jgi:hypothetical protein
MRGPSTLHSWVMIRCNCGWRAENEMNSRTSSLSFDAVGSVIAGVSTVEQLEKYVAAASWRLSLDERAEVEALTGGPAPSPERPPYA